MVCLLRNGWQQPLQWLLQIYIYIYIIHTYNIHLYTVHITYIYTRLCFVYEGISHWNSFQPSLICLKLCIFFMKNQFPCVLLSFRDSDAFLSFVFSCAKTPCHDEDGKTHCKSFRRRPIQWLSDEWFEYLSRFSCWDLQRILRKRWEKERFVTGGGNGLGHGGWFFNGDSQFRGWVMLPWWYFHIIGDKLINPSQHSGWKWRATHEIRIPVIKRWDDLLTHPQGLIMVEVKGNGGVESENSPENGKAWRFRHWLNHLFLRSVWFYWKT